MSFCQVIIKKPAIRLMEYIITGNQAWNGALPTFINKEILAKTFE